MNTKPLALDSVLDAQRLVEAEWGSKYANFVYEECITKEPKGLWTLVGRYEFSTNPPKLVSFCVISWPDITYDLWGITWVIVHPDYRGKGLGKELIQKCEQIIVDKSNGTAMVQLTCSIPRFYESMGYVGIHTWDATTLMIKRVK